MSVVERQLDISYRLAILLFVSDTEIAKKEKNIGIVRLPKAKYAETYSLEESAFFQPWKVVLKLELAEDIDELVDYVVFVRARDPQLAMYTAWKHFLSWKGTDPAYDFSYPKIHTYSEVLSPDKIPESEQSLAYPLDEDQWKEFWHEAQFYESHHWGHKDNPVTFTFFTPEWKNHVQYLLNTRMSVLVPDMSDMKVIAEKKAAIDRAAAKKFGK